MERVFHMKWLLPALALACILLIFGAVFFLLRPSQGKAATSIAIRQRAKMEAHPVRSFYLPVAFLLISFVLILPSAISEPTTEARLTRLLLALVPLLGVLLLLRIRRWPR